MCRWVKLHEALLDWEWHDDPMSVSLVVHLLLMANYKDVNYHGTVIKRGQRMIKVTELADRVGMSRQQIRTRLERLQESGFLTLTPTNKTTLITICNYDRYQCNDGAEQPTNNQQVTNNQPTNNQRIVKKEKNREEGNRDGVASQPKKLPLEERKQLFYDSIVPYVGKYSKEMCRAFFDYWTEPFVNNPNKMRFEDQKTWSVSGRLSTWFRKENNNATGNNHISNRTVQRELSTIARRAEIFQTLATSAAESNGSDTTVQLPPEF